MLVNLDINELWNFEIGENILAGVSYTETIEPHLLLLAVNRIQDSRSLMPKILELICDHDFSVNRFLPLPEKFNTPIAKDFEPGKIYRFTENPTFDAKDPFNEQFTSYFIQTPFCTPDSFGKIFNDQLCAFEELKKSTDEILNSIQREIKSKTENP